LARGKEEVMIMIKRKLGGVNPATACSGGTACIQPFAKGWMG